MGKIFNLLLLLMLMGILVEGKRGGGSSGWGRRGSSRGKSTSSTSTSSGGWFSWGKTTSHASAPAPKPAPAPAPSYGWQNPSYNKPSSSGVYPAKNPSHGWTNPGTALSPPKPSSGWQSSTNQRASNPSYGWNNPSPPKPPANPSSGWQSSTNQKASNPSYGWNNPSPPKPPANPSTGWQNPSSTLHKPSAPPLPPSANKPLPFAPVQVPNQSPKIPGSSYGWTNPSQPKPGQVGKPPVNSNLPSSNIGPGGYPVQGGIQRAGAPGHVNPPPYSATNPRGTSTLNQGKVPPPPYTPQGSSNVAPPSYSGSSYNGPKKQVINNHYHYNSPPSYSPSHYGMSSSYYPSHNNFGYPGGFFGNSRPSYGGMGLFSGGNGFGYPGSGSWGGYSSYGSRSGGMMKGLLIGAAGGYLANSLIRSISNPWGYGGYGYGHGYMDRYRYDDRRYPAPPPPGATPVPYDPTKNWINCVAYDPVTNTTLINPNCTCTVSTTTDQATGQNISHHDCTPYGMPPPPMVPSPALPVWGVNNPNFNGSLYGDSTAYGGVNYGSAGYGPPQQQATYAQVQGNPYGVAPPIEAPIQPYQSVKPEEQTSAKTLETSETPTEKPVSEALTGDVEAKRKQFYTQLQNIVSMGRFVDR